MRLEVVSLDLDGTLIHPAIFNAVADELGFGEPLRRSYDAYVAGTMTLEEAFWHDYGHFKGRKVDEMERALLKTRAWTPGIAAAVDELHGDGMTVVLTTDQPRFLAQFTKRFGVDALVCSDADVKDGVVGECRPAFEKWPNLKGWLDVEGIDPGNVAHVGNGANDVPVFRKVGYGLAVNAEKDEVVAAARASIPRVKDFREVSGHITGLL